MIYLLFFLASFILTYLVKEYASKKFLIAEVNERSSHTIPTPHGGGIAIAIVWFIGLGYLFLEDKIDPQLFYALLIGVLISIVSFFDDIFELSPKLRLIIQAIVAIGGIYCLGGLENIDIGIVNISNPFITNLFAFFMIVWYINLYNFLDGINGYAGSEAVFLSCAGLILFGDIHFALLSAAVLGFLFWNYNRAKIFMGDVGSTLLGYNTAIFTLYYANQGTENLWLWIILFSTYWFDATYTLIRRKINKERLSQAHKKHLYQRLTQSGWSHLKVTNYSILLNIVIFCLVFFLSSFLIIYFIVFIIFYLVVKFINAKKEF